ncbi:MAG: hypothetical protein ACYCXK_00150, partial [Candidatus Humimicrobiaceae bacterium]
MNNLINSLKAISAENFLAEKIIICPSFETGNQILENLVRSGQNWINFKIGTIYSLAFRVVETKIHERNLKAITPAEISFLIDEIFIKLSLENTLKYFKKQTINTGLVKAIS